MSISQSTTDWTKCFICQKQTKEKLRSTDEGRKSLALLLPKFASKNALGFEINRILVEGEHLEITLNTNNACYHHSCKNAYNNRMYERQLEKEKHESNLKRDNEIKSPPCKRRMSNISNKANPDEGVCCFCKCVDKQKNLVAAGTFHATKTKTQIDHVKNITAHWIEMAKVLEDENLLVQLSHGDVASNEMYYHKSNIKCCYQKYRKRYMKKINEKESKLDERSRERWFKIHCLNKVIHYIKQTENENPGRIFEIKQLENIYIEILQMYGYSIESHVSRFADLLKENMPGIELRNVGRKLTLCFTSTADAVMSDYIKDSNDFYQSMLDVALPLRQMMAETTNNLDETLGNLDQINSVPIHLLTLVSMLIDGPGVSNRHFSQPSLTIAQLVQTNFRKNKKNKVRDTRKIMKYKETPVTLYSTLKIYGTFRAKSVIDHFFNLGLCLSYDRILEYTKNLSDIQIKSYELTGVFSPSPLKTNLFTVVAKDNIDFNATSSTAVKHFHGTSMTVMQFPSLDNTGNENIIPESTHIFLKQQEKTSKKVLKIPESYTSVKPLNIRKTPLYAPNIKVDISQYFDEGEFIASEYSKEIKWLEKVANIDDIISWSKYHSDNSANTALQGLNAILPIIPKPVHTLATQYHCMEIIKNTISYLNPKQTPVDVCDQPVYALTKEIQWRFPEKFGSDAYFCLFGGLHFEQCILNILGELIKGSGLYEILSNNNLSIIGTGAFVNANHIKQARYCLQVSLCALFLKLIEAKNKSNPSSSPIEWLKEKKNHSEMCNYWYLIVTLELDILLYIRSLRESNYKLLVFAMKNLMKWIYSFDHYNYARWATVHLFDLMTIHETCPDVYEQFLKGNFSFQKTNRKFSKMALDQVHEQNNEKIKGVSGATHLLNRADMSGMERWETCSPEIAKIIENLEHSIESNTRNDLEKPHHEDRMSFQYNFSSDVKKVYNGFDLNPFEENNLVNISNTSISYGPEVQTSLQSLLVKGDSQYQEFLNERLIDRVKSIDAPIKRIITNCQETFMIKQNQK